MEPITDKNRSSEHIIHNAIGGTLEDDGIYCKTCNSRYGTDDDSGFTKIFAPLMHELDIRRSRKTPGTPYNGYLYGKSSGEIYEAKYKAGRITSVHDREGVYVQKNKEDFIPLALKFELDNAAFKNGLAKIAFNYAVHCGISPDDMERLFDSQSRKLLEKSSVFPFIPLTAFDKVMESCIDARLYHALRLFNIAGCLFVYIELFSTFQYYVLVSEHYKGSGLEESYCTFIEQADTDNSDIRTFTPSDYKDARIIMQDYGIDYDDIVSRLKEKNGFSPDIGMIFGSIGRTAFDKYRKNIYTTDYQSVIDMKFQSINPTKIGKDKLMDFFVGMEFYISEEDKINMSRYKKFLPDCSIYPEAVAGMCCKNFELARSYGHQKFHMLTSRFKAST